MALLSECRVYYCAAKRRLINIVLCVFPSRAVVVGYLFCYFLGIAVVATESPDRKSLSLLTEIIQRDQ